MAIPISKAEDSPKARKPGRPTSIAERVTGALVAAILDGTYVPGVRLPPERACPRGTGVSRIPVRRALARLESWRLVEITHGSGTVVLPRRRWSFDVLPAFIRHAASFRELRPVLLETLSLRHLLVTELLFRGGQPLRPGDLDPAREQVRLAMAAQDDLAAFLRHDLEKSRIVLEKRGLTATLWLLNSVADAVVHVAQTVPARLAVPRGYVAAHMKFFEALEAGDLEQAHTVIRRLFQRQDAAILAFLARMGDA